MIKLTPYLLILLIAACNFSKTKKAYANQTFAEFKSSLTERKIGDGNLYISLPENYLLKLSVGPDFSVYYFAPSDTSDKIGFSGGMYFGVAPSEFKSDSDCEISYLKAKILDRDTSWKLFSRNQAYFIQVIISGKKGADQLDKIHAFGSAKKRTDIDKMLFVFSTLKQDK